jgi:hypothetical protein
MYPKPKSWFFFLVLFLLIAPLRDIAIGAPKSDDRPLISAKYLSQQDFKDQGLWFWAEEGTALPPTNIPVVYIDGGDETSPTRRTLFLVGKWGQNLPIYCMSATSDRDVTLMLGAFLRGYVAAHSH